MIGLQCGHAAIPIDKINTTVLRSRFDELSSDRAGEEFVEEAMARPISSKTLWELANT